MALRKVGRECAHALTTVSVSSSREEALPNGRSAALAELAAAPQLAEASRRLDRQVLRYAAR